VHIDLSALKGLDHDLVAKFAQEYARESDRGAVLTTIAILDQSVTARLVDLLSRGSKEARDRLLQPPLGAVSGFMAKVDLCHCLGILPQALYHDIRLVNKLRNRCAHDWREFTINEEVFTVFVKPLHMWKAVRAGCQVMLDHDFPGVNIDLLPRRALFNGTMAAFVTTVNMWSPPKAPGAAGPRPAAGGEEIG
jgi:DNA-binding MltR family transcriptional regulator